MYPPVVDEGEGVVYQSEDGCYPVKESLLAQVQDQTWRFLDNMTWPEFLRRWIIARGTAGECEVADFMNGREYCQLDVDGKIALLNIICEDLLNSWIIRKEVQEREQMLEYLMKNEKQEVSERNRMSRGSNPTSGKSSILPENYDHLYIREGLDALESDVCDVTRVGGTLVCCDGCPASYLGRSVGLKRVGDDDQKWFCEECRIGGQIRSHRFLHRATSAMRWSAIPPVAIIGQGIDGLRCFTAHGRVYVGNGKNLFAYYSTIEKLEALAIFLKSTATGREVSPSVDPEDEPCDSGGKANLTPDTHTNARKLRPHCSDISSEEDSESEDESTWEAELVLKRKKKAILEQMKFRTTVEEKQLSSREYVNKYKDAMTLLEVSAFFNKGKERKRLDTSSSKKWTSWPRTQESGSDGKQALISVAAYLLSTEKNLFGLVDGPFLKTSGRKEWIEWVKQADDVAELSKAAIVFESAIRPSALIRNWFDNSDKKPQGRSRGPGRRSTKKDNREEVDWSELREAGILEDMNVSSQASVDEDENKQYLVWISGRQVMPLGVNLSRRSLRHIILTAGEAEVRGMMYRGASAVPSARLVWIREILDAKTTAQLTLQLRVFDEALRADIFRKPAIPSDPTIHSNVVERVVGSRDIGSGYMQYEVKMFGDDKVEWMSQENTPIYCIREFEAESRRAADAEAKSLWWKEFDFHPGAAVEVESENQWYQGYIVESIDQKSQSDKARNVGGLKWREGVGIVRVHYIGGFDDEDEFMYTDDERLRLDKKAESRLLRERARILKEASKINKIADKHQRMQLRLELYQERLRLRDEDHFSRYPRDPDKAREKEKREQVEI
jgi:hypothetical protein